MKRVHQFFERMEYFWRNVFVYPILRIIVHNYQMHKNIDIRSVKKLLILRYDRIGDMIVTTPILKGLKSANPNLYLGIVASTKNVDIIKHNPHVDKIHVFSTKWWQVLNEMRAIRKEEYDIVLNFIFTKMTLGGILINIIAPHGIKIGQGERKYQFYYNRLLSLPRDNKRMIDILGTYVKEALGIDITMSHCEYDIILDDKTRARVRSFLDKNHLASRQMHMPNRLPYSVFNLSASDEKSKLSVTQVETLGIILSKKKIFRIVIIYAPDDHEMQKAAQRICAEVQSIIFPEQGIATLLDIAALIEGALCVFTPDTSVVHFASAMQTPVLGLYSSAKEKVEWLPYKVKHKVVMSDNDQPTSSIPIPTIIDAMDEFIQGL